MQEFTMKKLVLLLLITFCKSYASDGTLDHSFGVNGLMTFPQISETVGFPGFGTFIQTNGAIVIAGTMPSIGQGFLRA